jgi:glycosyltransferase involved in cell wall biosynthesis
MSLRIGFLISHPIQYYTPIFRELAGLCELSVFFAHRQTAEQQARAGFGVAFDWDIDLLSGYRSKFLDNVSKQPSTDRYGGCDTPGIAREIADGGFDAFVVPGWGFRSYLQAAKACRCAGVPVFVRGDSQLIGQRHLLLRIAKAIAFARVLRRFDGYLYVGQRNREYLLHYRAPADRLFFSPHCVDNEVFRVASDAVRSARESVPRVGARNKRILFVGKLVSRKNPADVLRAAALVRHKQPVEVAYAGSGELEPMLRQLAQEVGVPTIFHGFVNQSEMPAVYAAADVMVLPSDGLETWGLAVNEAMACGVPAVVSDAVGCGPDLVEPGMTGAVFPVGRVADFATAIERVLAFDSVLARQQLAARMQIFSPRGAAQGIIRAAAALAV